MPSSACAASLRARPSFPTRRSSDLAGASRGAHEAVDLRDGGARLGGLGVRGAVANVNGPIAAALTGMDAHDQTAIDGALVALDGTPDKSRPGGKAILATSPAGLGTAAAGRAET